MTRWLVFYDSDFMEEAETAQDAAELYAERNEAAFGQTVVVIEANPAGAGIQRFRFGAVPMQNGTPGAVTSEAPTPVRGESA